ncbi:MAG TPA: SusE domain-containing protein [Bacteroidales bacterium]|nr:SusE domain-containing protein [Bacteroidales bacterium]HPM17065.1 SusE domain-containing protein [Bacteroidales bacterium]
MKILKYLFAAAIVSLSAVSCEVISEDAFSTAPVPPEMYAHSDILMTSNTMDEFVNFSWKPARFLGEGLTYDLYGKFGESTTKLASTSELYYRVPKTEFKTALYSAFPALPENDTFTMSFFVSVTNQDESFESDPVTIDIYAYGDAVSPETSALVESIVLDVTDPEGVLELLTWEPARLGYNEEITYSVSLQYGETAAIVLLASDLKETSFSITVDALNEAAVAAGAPEAAAADLDFTVRAFSATYPDGVISNTVTINVTTYIATYPEYMYVPGAYQGWNPATAPKIKHSSVTKGLYEGMIDLSVEGGGDVGFKFSPVPAWENDFAIANIEKTTFGNGYTALTGKGTTGGDITAPSGMYNILLNKKLNTLYMIQVETLSLIGSAPVASNGWVNDIDMTYDPVAHTFSAITNMQEGEFKIRVNHDWTHSAGGTVDNVSFGKGDNISFTRTPGEYKVVLNVGVNPYTIKFINTSFPEKMYVPGNHQGWNPAAAPVLNGDNEGHYEGYVTLTDIFKFTSAPDWNHTNYGGSMESLDTDPSAGNLQVPAPGYYYLKVDLTTMSATATLIDRVGVIGSFTGWGEDVPMTYDPNTDLWTATNLPFPAGTEYKFRMNNDWAINLGGDPNDLKQDGANLKADAGMYTVILSLATTPYHMTITRTGDLVSEYGTEVVVAGDYSGHSWSATDDPKLQGSGDGTYKGAITMYNMQYGFKIVESGNWIAGQLVADSQYEFTLYTGDNMMLPNGTYFWSVDLPDTKAVATPVTVVGLIGSFEGSAWGTDVAMDFDQETLTYSATLNLAAGNEFKIRFNNNWDLNLGGDITNLTHNGANIMVQEAGTYRIVLNMANTSSLTMTKQ